MVFDVECSFFGMEIEFLLEFVIGFVNWSVRNLLFFFWFVFFSFVFFLCGFGLLLVVINYEVGLLFFYDCFYKLDCIVINISLVIGRVDFIV